MRWCIDLSKSCPFHFGIAPIWLFYKPGPSLLVPIMQHSEMAQEHPRQSIKFHKTISLGNFNTILWYMFSVRTPEGIIFGVEWRSLHSALLYSLHMCKIMSESALDKYLRHILYPTCWPINWYVFLAWYCMHTLWHEVLPFVFPLETTFWRPESKISFVCVLPFESNEYRPCLPCIIKTYQTLHEIWRNVRIDNINMAALWRDIPLSDFHNCMAQDDAWASAERNLRLNLFYDHFASAATCRTRFHTNQHICDIVSYWVFVPVELSEHR